ncbi:MAG: bifunctional folylpolyglutamate synthase/dihydrofolate synthase [Deltaproteobacteria bacterium]|nr:bifunctional folylpolyglutamate synthase/dihydrofolate synthase [Deltaproteobacteria bacterium]
MDFASAISYLDSLQSTKIELGLERMSAVCKLLGNPENKFTSVVVAGTNGKGSTCAFLESILRHNGLKAGLLTSPHLLDVRERIQIDREMISEKEFGNLAENLHCHCEFASGGRSNLPNSELEIASSLDKLGARNDMQFTYFEFLTAMAFQYFAEAKVDIAVLEVGLGGRLDATNVVTPVISVITRIGIDHQKYLGDTIEKIAFEKCGIIKRGVPVVTVDQDEKAMDVIRKASDENGAMLHVVSPHEVKWPLGLNGSHQLENAALAVRAAEIVTPSLSLPPRGGGKGRGGGVIEMALASTSWPGRLAVVSKNPLVILDGAHNPNGAEALAKYLMSLPGKRIIMLGIMADKDIDGIVKPLADAADEIVITKPSIERAADPK